MYVRIKRKKTTVFLHVEPTDTILEVKQKLQELVEQVRAMLRLPCCSQEATHRAFACAGTGTHNQRTGECGAARLRQCQCPSVTCEQGPVAQCS